MSEKILIVDDDEDFCELLSEGLSSHGFSVSVAHDSASALDLVQRSDFGAVGLDVELGEESGIELCKQLVENRPGWPVLIMTGHGELDVAIQAIRAGAYDFIAKPFKVEAFTLALRRALDHRQLREEVHLLRERATGREPRIDSMIGESRPMKRVYELVEQVAEGEATVLIAGESGTGKELVARAIHEGSKRKDGPFVVLNCAAVTASLLESELFGHTKGAFTDAKSSRAGVFVEASGGTLFLDEIGEMPMDMQAKLLRVIQERKVRPVGSDIESDFDTRIVTATNRDLETEVEEGRFRQDLFYRINVVQIPLPPLRARGTDILKLAQRFLERYAEQLGKDVVGVSQAAAQKLMAYDWPGNVRELENCMERAVTLTRVNEITPQDLPENVCEYQSSRIVLGGDNPEEMPPLEEMEKRYIRTVLQAVKGNKTHAAKVLGVDRRTLYRKMERLEIEAPNG